MMEFNDFRLDVFGYADMVIDLIARDPRKRHIMSPQLRVASKSITSMFKYDPKFKVDEDAVSVTWYTSQILNKSCIVVTNGIFVADECEICDNFSFPIPFPGYNRSEVFLLCAYLDMLERSKKDKYTFHDTVNNEFLYSTGVFPFVEYTDFIHQLYNTSVLSVEFIMAIAVQCALEELGSITGYSVASTMKNRMKSIGLVDIDHSMDPGITEEMIQQLKDREVHVLELAEFVKDLILTDRGTPLEKNATLIEYMYKNYDKIKK